MRLYSNIIDNMMANFEPINKQNTLSAQVLQQIAQDIIQGKIAQGSKLVETNLAKTYKISRGPLREALLSLEDMNLAQRTPHSGARIITLTLNLMQEVYQIREALEGMAARLATSNISPNEIKSLYQILTKHEKSMVKAKQYLQTKADLDFHGFIIAKCGNNTLIEYLHNKLYYVVRMGKLSTNKMPFRSEIALREHRNIVDAISNNDGELAEILMRRHIKGAWQHTKKILFTEKT